MPNSFKNKASPENLFLKLLFLIVIIVVAKKQRNKNVDTNLMGFFTSMNKFLELLIHKGLKTASKLPIIKNATAPVNIFIYNSEENNTIPAKIVK